MRLSPFLVVAGLLLSPFALPAQSYRPTYAEPTGRELVAVYVGATGCGPCRSPEMPRVLDSMKLQLQRRAQGAGQQFRAVVVALDWVPDSGFALAREDGAWDEVITGRNWFGLGAAQYIWADSTVAPSMPQVILYEQEVTIGARVKLSEPRILRRIVGAVEIQRWVRQGVPTS
jgi:hypothetical protein